MKHKYKVSIVNFLILVGCLYLAYAQGDYGFCLLLYVMTLFTFNCIVIISGMNKVVYSPK